MHVITVFCDMIKPNKKFELATTPKIFVEYSLDDHRYVT